MTKKTNTQAITHDEAVQGANLASGTSAPAVTVTETAAIPFDYNKLLEEHKTKSAIIRFLDSQGHKKGPISRFMGIKYQFVRNVLNQPLKKTA